MIKVYILTSRDLFPTTKCPVFFLKLETSQLCATYLTDDWEYFQTVDAHTLCYKLATWQNKTLADS